MTIKLLKTEVNQKKIRLIEKSPNSVYTFILSNKFDNTEYNYGEIVDTNSGDYSTFNIDISSYKEGEYIYTILTDNKIARKGLCYII